MDFFFEHHGLVYGLVYAARYAAAFPSYIFTDIGVPQNSRRRVDCRLARLDKARLSRHKARPCAQYLSHDRLIRMLTDKVADFPALGYRSKDAAHARVLLRVKQRENKLGSYREIARRTRGVCDLLRPYVGE